MPNRLKDKVAVVVGAGSIGPGWGNGKATAVTFAREGAKVFCVDINLSAAEETASIIMSEGGLALDRRSLFFLLRLEGRPHSSHPHHGGGICEQARAGERDPARPDADADGRVLGWAGAVLCGRRRRGDVAHQSGTSADGDRRRS